MSVATSSKNDPAATDLDYYSKPENYTGSTLQSLQRFKADKTKEDAANRKQAKKRKIKDAKYYFFHRYKHILKDVIFLDDLVEREYEAESEDESEEGMEEGGDKTERRSPPEEALKPILEEDTAEFDRKGRISARSTDIPSPDVALPVATRSTYTDDRPGTPDSPEHLTPTGRTSGKQHTAIQRAERDKAAREMRAKILKERFKRCVKGIKAVCKLSASARSKNAGGEMANMRTFMDIANDETSTEENMKNAGLSFDPNYYKAKREISLSSETKAILTSAPEDRSPEQVQTAMFGLQSLRSYAEYPLHMQEKLAKVAWYEIVAPKRIIIRQGHYAENFYFILSGHAVVTILLKDPKTGASFVKTATVMKKGMSFGELALLHRSKRTATVTSQDTVQLLSIGREDFFDIFMSGGEDNMPEHIRFVSNLDFMKDWPIDELVEHPEHCLLHFFKRNTAIVANSNASDWLYIVKSGSCVVLKKLKGVTAKSHRSAQRAKEDEFLTPKLRAVVYAPKVDTNLRSRKNPVKQQEIGKATSAPPYRGGNQTKRFSKEAYCKNPVTKSAHFSAKPGKSNLAKRMCYTPPPRCLPKKLPPPAAGPSKPGPVFVQVSIMKPRDVFGLDSIKFEDDIQRSHTTVSLVSRGAECIMLSKAFFVKHANEAVKKCIRESVRQYPEEDVFQDNLQIKENWIMYKKVVLNDVTSEIEENSNRLNS